MACNHPPIWCQHGKNDCVSTIILSTLKNYKLDPLQGASSPTLTMLLGNPCITFDTWEEPWNQREVTRKTDLLWENYPHDLSFDMMRRVGAPSPHFWSSIPSVVAWRHPHPLCIEGAMTIHHIQENYYRLLQNQGSNKQINDIEKKSTTSQFEFFSSLFLGCFPLACLLPTKHLLPERISRRPNLRYQPLRNSKTNCFMESPI